MKYCMDASAIIDLGQRHYPERLPIFRPIWDFIYEGIDAGTIVSVDYIETELTKRADEEWREQFLGRASQMFRIDEDIEQAYAAVISDLENIAELPMNKHRERFMSGGDPWLIALCRSLGEAKVVSSELKPLQYYGLGAICGRLNVDHISILDLIDENKVGQ